MMDTQDKMTIKKNGVNINLNARKGRNGSTVLYLNNLTLIPEVLSHQESNINLTAEDKDKDEKYNK